MVVLPVVSLRERVVEIVLDRGAGQAARYRYGSGFRLGGRLVLTAAHVVAGAAAAGITVRGSDKVPHPARVVDGLAGDPDTVDLALLELRDEIAELPAPPVAAVDRDAPVPVPVEGCWAVGYPLFQEVPSGAGVVRETAQVWGMILPAENLVGGLLSLQVTSAPRALPPRQEALGESQWSGMSGAAVLAGEWLIGVVSEHAPRRGESTITVTPLASLGRLPDAAAARWWAHLAADPKRLVMLPAHRARAEPAYRATLRQLRARTGVLQGRDKEKEAIAAFATGQPSTLAPPGSQHAWLVGGPWAGKTALLAEAVHALPPEVDCVAYFLTRPTGDADRERFLAAVVPQLAWLLGTDLPSTLDVDAFRQLWEQAAQHAADQGRQLLLIVDGLDEDLRPGGYSVAGWLPGRLPGLPARVLVASRLYPRLPDDVDPAHPLAGLTPGQPYTLANNDHAAKQRDLADQEITQLLRRASDDLALDVLGLLTAAGGGPLAAADLAALTGSRPWKVRGVLDGEAARILQRVGPAGTPRYAFAHETLLDRCQEHGVGDPGHTRRIEEWAATWRDRGWPAARDGQDGTPLYLLDRYPQTLYGDPPRLAALTGDAGWVDAAIQQVGVDGVLADLRRAAGGPERSAMAALLATVEGQAHYLRSSLQPAQPGYVLRQLCMQAMELAEDSLAASLRARLRSLPDPGPVPLRTTRRANRALIADLSRRRERRGHGTRVQVAALPDGRVVGGGDRGGHLLVWDPREPGAKPVVLSAHDDFVRDIDTVLWVTVAVLPDGRIISGSADSYNGRVRMWDPNSPEAGPTELGSQDQVKALAALEDGRVVSGDITGRLLVWNPSQPGSGPVGLGWYGGRVLALTGLPDGRVVSGDVAGQLLVWNPSQPGAEPVELGRHDGPVYAVAGLGGGRLVSGGWDGRVLVWDLAAAGTKPVELGRRNGPVDAVAALRDGRVVSGGRDGRVLVWAPDSPGAGPVEIGRHDDGVSTIAELPNGQLASGDFGGRVLVWDPGAPGVRPVESGSHVGEVLPMAALQDGRVVGVGAGRVQVWDPAAGDAQPVELGERGGGVQAVAVLPGGRVVIGSGAGRLLVLKIDEPAAGPVELVGDTEAVQEVAVLPDGRLVSGNHGGRLLVWNPDQPEAGPVELGHHGGQLSALVALQDGQVVSGGYDGRMGGISEYAGRLRVWNPSQPGAEPAELGSHRERVRAVAELPDGRVISGWADGRVLVWDRSAPEAEPIEVGRHDGPVEAVIVLPDGQVLTGGDDRSVRLWDVQTKQCCWSVACSVRALTVAVPNSGETLLLITHQGTGVSTWSIRADTRPRAPQP